MTNKKTIHRTLNNIIDQLKCFCASIEEELEHTNLQITRQSELIEHYKMLLKKQKEEQNEQGTRDKKPERPIRK